MPCFSLVVERLIALVAGGGLWAWGENGYGQLGDGGGEEKLLVLFAVFWYAKAIVF